MKVFDFEVRWARLVLRTIVPASVLDGVVADLDLGQKFREECAQPPWYSGLLLRFAIWLVWWAPIFMMPGQRRTFGRLPPAAQTEVLERLLKSDAHNLRLAITFLKLTACMFALGDRRALAALDAYGLRQAS